LFEKIVRREAICIIQFIRKQCASLLSFLPFLLLQLLEYMARSG